MKKINHSVALLTGPTEDSWNISWRAGNMFLNLLCIDEAAAFDSPGVYFLKDSYENVEPDEPNKKKLRLEPGKRSRGKRILK